MRVALVIECDIVEMTSGLEVTKEEALALAGAILPLAAVQVEDPDWVEIMEHAERADLEMLEVRNVTSRVVFGPTTAWESVGPCPKCDEASVVDESGCCIHCGADRTEEA